MKKLEEMFHSKLNQILTNEPINRLTKLIMKEKSYTKGNYYIIIIFSIKQKIEINNSWETSYDA